LVVVVGQLQLSELAQLEPIIYLPVVLVVVRVQITAMVMVRLQEKILVVMSLVVITGKLGQGPVKQAPIPRQIRVSMAVDLAAVPTDMQAQLVAHQRWVKDEEAVILAVQVMQVAVVVQEQQEQTPLVPAALD
jgi:hypothetical protein